MNLLDALIRLRDDLKLWVINNIKALRAEIDKKSEFSGDYNDLENKPDISSIESDLSNHAYDNERHITDSERNAWNNHALDSEIHVTDLDKDYWNSHIDERDSHVSSGDRIRWDNKSDFSGNYNDLIDAPDIYDDEEEGIKFVDDAGNIILAIDNQGLHTTNIKLEDKLETDSISTNELLINNEDIIDIIDDKIENVEGLVNDIEAQLMSDVASLEGALSNHEYDSEKHITNSERNAWNSHALDSEVHVTNADKDNWNDHVDTTDLHVSANDRIRWDNKSDFSGVYSDLIDAPEIYDDGEEGIKFIDDANNIILAIDNQGLHTTNLELIGDINAINLDVESASITRLSLGDEDILDIVDDKIDDASNSMQAIIDELELSLNELESDVNIITDISITNIESNIDSIKSDINEIELDISGIEADISVIEQNINNINEDIGTLDNSLQQHERDNNLHINNTERNAWNSHATDPEPHVTIADKNNWNEHVDATDSHVSSPDRIRWDNKSDFSGIYSDLVDAPEIYDDEEEGIRFIDDASNIILTIDNQGLHTTNIELVGDLKAVDIEATTVSTNELLVNEADVFDTVDIMIEASLTSSINELLDTLTFAMTEM